MFGVVERGDGLRMMHVPDLKTWTVHATVGAPVAFGTNLVSDEHPSLAGLQGRDDGGGLPHQSRERGV